MCGVSIEGRLEKRLGLDTIVLDSFMKSLIVHVLRKIHKISLSQKRTNNISEIFKIYNDKWTKFGFENF